MKLLWLLWTITFLENDFPLFFTKPLQNEQAVVFFSPPCSNQQTQLSSGKSRSSAVVHHALYQVQPLSRCCGSRAGMRGWGRRDARLCKVTGQRSVCREQ